MRYFALIFALPFIGGPIAMLAMFWGKQGFGGPPLAMKLFGTFVCVAVAAGGFAIAYGILFGKVPKGNLRGVTAPGETSGKGDYSCEHCGASIGTDSEISPSGDVKCEYCKSWFNVNRV